jgi:protein SCO1/2
MTSALAILARRFAATALAAAVLGGGAAQGQSEFNEDLPPELGGVDIVERLGERLPLEVEFVDDRGERIRLGSLFDGERPVLLQLGYFRCPLLCNLVLNGMVKAIGGVDWNAGDRYRVVAVSVNPSEGHELAAAKKQGYLVEYGRPGVASGWHFLTGPEESSRALADAVGFGYRTQSDGEIAHAAAIFVITPDGRVSRYLYGTRYDEKNLRLALLEASQGQMGSSWDRFILWCYRFDPDAGQYVIVAMRVMQIGGALTVLLLAGGLGFMWWREMRSRPDGEAGPANMAEMPR